MGVLFSRRHLRLILLTTLFAAGSAQAGTVCLSRSALCDALQPSAAERVVGLDVQLSTAAYGNVLVSPGADISLGDRSTISRIGSPTPISWELFDIGSGGVITLRYPSNSDTLQRINASEWNNDRNHGWTTADATQHVSNSMYRRDHDIDEFRRHWHRSDHDHHRHDGDDVDPPKPTPLPGAALLFGPALLMLRAFQRRNA